LLQKLADEAKQRQLSGAALAEIESALNAQDYVHLAELVEARQAGLAAERGKLVQQLAETGDQARLVATKSMLEALDQEIETAARQQVTALQDEISLSNGLSVAFRRQIEATLSDLQLPRDVSAELARLQRDAETRRTLYESSLAKLRQVQQQSDFEIPDSRVIAYATPPNAASYPPVSLIIVGAIFLGLSAGVGLAFLREHFIGGIASIEQLENLAQIPVVAGVPRYVPSTAREQADMAIVTRPLSPFSEAVRRIQLGIDVLAPKGKRCIFVTSATPSEGKTTLAISLARQMAATGVSTLLIDADMRHPTVHQYLNERAEGGLISFLSQGHGAAADQLSIVREAATGVSYVLGAPSSATATDALLLSGRFAQLLSFARENYDVVIIDTPPVGLVVDAAIIARHCDIGVFVARYALTNQHQIRSSLRDLRRAEVPIIGVLNDVRGEEGYRYGKYRQYYGQAA
jgi:capsular exopolysaccharide synthesis family protein